MYLGNGLIITAAHVVSPAARTKPSVRIAGMDLPAHAIKEGYFEPVDLTLLSIDERKLPIYLQMRRMPLCDNKPWPGEPVIVAIPEGTARSHIMLPSLLSAQFQKIFSPVIRDVATTGNSGSGVFDAGQKCLLGIIRLKIYQTPSSGAPESGPRRFQHFTVGLTHQLSPCYLTCGYVRGAVLRAFLGKPLSLREAPPGSQTSR